MTFTQKLTFERETKNTFVFKAPKDDAIDTLYIQKFAFTLGGAQPSKGLEIEVTVTV